MALITSILPDVDGDLHTAALHNSKFQTILNELNGNIDLDNLKYPKSFMTLSCRAGAAYDNSAGSGAAAARNPFGYIQISAVDGSTIADSPNIFVTNNDRIHVLTNSFHQVPANSSYTIEDVNVVAIKRNATYFTDSGVGTAGDFKFTLQKCATLTGTWTNLWQVDDDDLFNSAGDIFAEVGASEAPSVTTVASTNWIRFTLQNPSGWGAGTKLAPELMVNVVVKVSHVA
jgi:hypothetical protein